MEPRQAASLVMAKTNAQRRSETGAGIVKPTRELAALKEANSEGRLIQLWAQGDFNAALEAFLAYARVNPERALDLAMQMEGGEAWRLVMDLVLKLPPHVGGIAMDVLLRHPQYLMACPPFDAVFCLCAKSDPERAWREAHAAGVKFTEAALDAIARGSAEMNPRFTMTLAARLRNREQKDKFTRTVLREWSQNKARDLIAWMETQGDIESLAMMVPWGKLSFDTKEDFLAMVNILPLNVLDGSNNEYFGLGTAPKDGWATRLDWLQEIQGEARTPLFVGAARALVGSDPEKALALLPEITNMRVKNMITSATAAYRAVVSPQEGFAFADSLADESAKRLARESVLKTWAENDPAAAARHALASDDKLDKNVHYDLGHKWAALDPQSAASYALAHETINPESSSLSTMFGAAMNSWVNDDPYAASRWATELPVGNQRDRAAAALAQSAVRSEPNGALQWAAGIADETLRRQTVEACFGKWLNQDRAQAVTWMEQASLDENTRQALGTIIQSEQETQQNSNRWRSNNGVIVVY